MNEQFEGLLSKKQLLEMYHISYGALYRWKRKGLIPDEWFIRKTTTTGQETFFPKDKIIERVELILKGKEDTLLDDLKEELTKTEENELSLIVDTLLGEKKILMNELKSIKIQMGKQMKDITDDLHKMMEELKNEH